MITTLKRRLKAIGLCAGLLSTLGAQADVIQITGNLTGIHTWRSTNEYVLNGFVYVLSPGVLNIEPGTVVRGKAGTGLNSSCLFITQGAKIFANGTRSKPIVFCSESDDLNDPNDIALWQRGLWGGIVIYGKATLNTTSDVKGNAATPKYELFEGLPDSVVEGQNINRYGGSDDDDSSGVLRYVSIRNSSTVILPDKEVNGLSLCGVGRGTQVDHIEVFGAADDSVEFFGGTVNTKYMASIFSDDDNFDIDMGYRGKNQFWFALQAPDKKDQGGEWNGEPNGIGVGNAPVMNFEIYNATYIGAGTNTSGSRALISRVHAAPKVFNSIFTEFNAGVNIDATSGTQFTNGVAKFQNNILWNFATNGVPVAYAQNATADWLLKDAANRNEFVNPLLTSISRTNVPAFKLDPRPQSGSPALTSSLTAPDDGFYSPVAYRGAFDAEDLWLADWTFASQVGLVPHRPQLGDSAHTVQITGNLSGTHHWYQTNTYVLNGFVYVLANSTLHIEPGTVIRGKAGTGLNSSCLFITQGAKIMANGTPHNPIIFCSESDDLDDPNDIPLWQRGLWGGLVIYGKATLNTTSDVKGNAASPKYELFEGLPDSVVEGQNINRYGGNDDTDNSGVLRYVSIRNSSTVILPDKEVNGLSLCGVGSGTKVEHIEIFGAADDSVEFFGGTVNTKYIASFFSDDDNFDIDMGYRGKNQFWFILQASDKKDQGGEWNGEPNGIGIGNAPTGNFEIYNATYIGAGANSSGGRAFISRVYAAPKVFNSIFTEFNAGVNIDATSGLQFTNGVAKFQHNLLWNFATNGIAVPYFQNTTAGWVLTNAANANLFADPMLTSISRTNFPAFQLDPRPRAGSPALTSDLTAPNDGFYTPVAYKGAFKDVNWASEWGFAAESGLISGEAAGVPSRVQSPVVVEPAIAPTLSIQREGLSIKVSFTSQAGRSYQLQSASTIKGGWSNVGQPTQGTGSSLSISQAINGSEQYLRVLAQ